MELWKVWPVSMTPQSGLLSLAEQHTFICWTMHLLFVNISSTLQDLTLSGNG